MTSEAKAVVVARALIEDGVEVRHEAMRPIHVQVGQPLTIRFAYHIAEASPLKETWHLRLKTRHDGADRLSSHERRDTPLLRDVLWDAVDETFVFEDEGSATVHFEAIASMSRAPWVGRRVPSHQDGVVTGAITVMVLP